MLKRTTPRNLVACLGGLTALAAIAAVAAFAAVPPNLTKAIEAQQRLAAERPQDSAVYNDLGNLLLLASRPAEAETAYRQAVELDPVKVSALFNLASLLQQRGELKEAGQLYRRVVEADPQHAWAHYQMGTLYEHWKQNDKAVEAYARAFALDPQLTFAEVNPHIADNKLVMKAVLRAYRDEGAVPRAPKFYEDPARIANLLVPAPATAARDQVAAEQTAPAQPGTRPGAQPPPTVLRERDLNTSGNVGQAAPGGRGNTGGSRSATPPRGLRQWTRPDPSMQNMPDDAVAFPDEGTDPEQVITPPPGGVYYRPGIQSTGRLNIQVLPDRKNAREGRG